MAITDDFNRSDGWIGTNWQLMFGNRWNIVSNTARPVTTFQDSLLSRAERSFPSNHYAQAKCEITSNVDYSTSGPAARIQPDGRCYFAILGLTGPGLYLRTSPTTTTYLGDWPTTMTADTLYTVKVDATGSTIKVFIDGTERISVTDTTLTGGKPGISGDAGAGTLCRVDDFECTDATDTSIPPVAYFNYAAAVNGAAAVTPTIPASVEADDILLLFVESANQAISLSTANGFAEVTNSPQGTGTAGGTAATRLAVFWKRAVGGDSAPTVADSGDHQVAQIIAIRGCIATGNPWDVTAGDVLGTASATVTIPGATTTVDNCLVIAAVANATDSTVIQTSGWTNADLTDLSEVLDVNVTIGNGGGFGVARGWKWSAGAYGSTTATLVTSSVQGRMSIALKPPTPAATFPAGHLEGLQYNALLRM